MSIQLNRLFALALILVASGAWAQRSTPVTVVNGAANPVPVLSAQDLYPRTGFATRVSVAFGLFKGIPTSDRVAGDAFVSPADATLVLEQMSLRATQANDDQVAFVEIRFTSGGQSVSHSLMVPTGLATLPAGGTQKITNYTWPLAVIVDPGTEVTLNLNSTTGSSTGSAQYVVSGYLVPAGSPGLGR
ncbi:MAG: hypothetical protein KDH20_13900 [Rhodocyclaceae bacterium]|nr:hypothetical protein [Rhodocyclaceae bacterium]